MTARPANLRFELPIEELARLCRKFDVTEMRVFGSALRDDFRPESDVDLLITFAPGARQTLLDVVAFRDELSSLLGRKVDLVSRTAVERSRNRARRDEILSTAQVV